MESTDSMIAAACKKLRGIVHGVPLSSGFLDREREYPVIYSGREFFAIQVRSRLHLDCT